MMFLAVSAAMLSIATMFALLHIFTATTVILVFFGVLHFGVGVSELAKTS